MKKTIVLMRPNKSVLGYALFLAVNATGVWGGVFPFMPESIQTADILFWFYLALSLALFVIFLVGARLSYFLMHVRPFTQVFCASSVYFAGWACLIAAMYVHAHDLLLSVFGGILLGAGSGMFYMLWQRLFASGDGDDSLKNMLVGFAYAPIFYFALYGLPRAVVVFLIPLVALPLFALALVIDNRTIDFTQPMFADSPYEHKQVYHHAISSMWRSALCMGAIAFCTGSTRALAIKTPAIGSMVNLLSMGALLVASVVVLVLWNFKGLKLNIIKLYRFIFPVLITSFLILPIANERFGRYLAAALYALYSIGLILTMLQCAQISRDRGINPFFAFGVFGGIVYGLHDVGFILGSLFQQPIVPAMNDSALIAMTAIYLLALMFFIESVNFKEAAPRLFESNTIELLAPVDETPQNAEASMDADVSGTSKTVLSTRKRTASDVVFSVTNQHESAYEKALRHIANEYRLTERETEVAGLIARGIPAPRIAEELFITENTVRTHKKRIYAKLGIHKKQELIDLVHKGN